MSDLQPGTRLVHKPTGKTVTLSHRKKPTDTGAVPPFHPGWWLTGTDGGLADFVVDAPDSPWEVAREP